MRKPERIRDRIRKKEVTDLFNQICSKEKMLQIYILNYHDQKIQQALRAIYGTLDNCFDLIRSHLSLCVSLSISVCLSLSLSLTGPLS